MPFDAARLVAARRLRGLTRRQLAEQTGQDVTAIANFEAFVSQPSRATVRMFEQTLDVRPGYFSQGRPMAVAGLESLFFRSTTDHNVTARRQALELAKLVWELKRALAQKISFPTLDMPMRYENDPQQSPETAARRLRSRWQLGNGPVPALVRLIESRGVLVVDTPAHCDAIPPEAFTYRDVAAPIIVLPPQHGSASLAQRRFAAAHELGHIVMHTSCTSQHGVMEHEADRFAVEFLAPQRPLGALLPERFNLNKLSALSQHWGVPINILADQTGDLGIISRTTARTWQARLRDDAHTGQQEDGYDDQDHAGERPAALGEATRLAAGVGLTMATIAAQLRVKVKSLNALFPDDHDSTLPLKVLR